MKALLSGLKVLDLSRLLPGPLCTQLLADMGAEIIKIEQLPHGDPMRLAPPHLKDGSFLFSSINRNKRSLTLDLQKKEAKEIFFKLVKASDVVIESFRPNVMERLALSYETLKKINPKIIFCSVTGYGQTGPYKNLPGHDINFVGYAGILDQTGYQGQPPAVSNFQIGDLAGGTLMATTSILAATLHAHKTGEGSHLDVSMLEGALALSVMGLNQEVFSKGTGKKFSRGDSFVNGGAPGYGVYETKDKRYMAIGTIEEKFWKNFTRLVKRPDLEPLFGTRGEDSTKLRKEMELLFKSQSQDYWTKLLSMEETCVSPVLHFSEVLMDKHIRARGLVIEGESPQFAFPVMVDGERGSIKRPAPRVGEHNSEILSGLGYGDDQINKFKQEGVI